MHIMLDGKHYLLIGMIVVPMKQAIQCLLAFDEIYYVQVGDKAGIINYGTSYADYTYSGKIQLSFVKEENVYFQAAYLNQGQGEAEGAYLNWYIKSVIQ